MAILVFCYSDFERGPNFPGAIKTNNWHSLIIMLQKKNKGFPTIKALCVRCRALSTMARNILAKNNATLCRKRHLLISRHFRRTRLLKSRRCRGRRILICRSCRRRRLSTSRRYRAWRVIISRRRLRAHDAMVPATPSRLTAGARIHKNTATKKDVHGVLCQCNEKTKVVATLAKHNGA